MWISELCLGKSLTHVAPSSNKDFLVTPGRMAPDRGGVAISGSPWKQEVKIWQQYYTIQLCHTLAIQETLFRMHTNMISYLHLRLSSLQRCSWYQPQWAMWKQLHAKFITLSNCSVGQYFSCIVYSVASEEKGGLGGEREEEKQEHGKGGNLGTVRTSRDSNVIW